MQKTDVLHKDDDLLRQQDRVVEDIISVRYITSQNAVFSRTEGGFVGLRFTGEDGEEQIYPRVAIHRCFPFSDPTRYISVREPEGDGREIGLIENLTALDKDTQDVLEEQMALRYFAPIITRIRHIREEYGYSYWDVITDKGPCRFTVRMGGGNVYPIGTNRYLINDIDGNRFEIPDIYQLTPWEIKRLDLFI